MCLDVASSLSPKLQKRLPCRQRVGAIRWVFTLCPLVFCRNSVIAVDLAISKETDTFHPHKQTRLYGVTTALSQCPQGNSPVLLLFRGWGCPEAPSPHPGCYLSGLSQP